jgi:hypothetical protein
MYENEEFESISVSKSIGVGLAHKNMSAKVAKGDKV